MSGVLLRRPWLLGVALFLFVWGLTTHGKHSAVGDEPHYLAVTRSLAHDHDLDVSNNYDPAGDPSGSGQGGLQPGPHARLALDGRLLPTQDVGLPVLLLPIYAVASRVAARAPLDLLQRFRMTRGLFEYSLISLTLLACVSVAIGLLASALRQVTTPSWALAIAAAVGFSPPVLSHSFLIFPETIAFVVSCALVWWLVQRAPPVWTTWLVGAALAWLPWCHRKFALFVIVCGIVMVCRRWAAWRTVPLRVVGGAVLFLIPQAAFHLWTLRTWGSLGGPQMLDGVPFTGTGALRGLLGLLMDRQSGLIAYTPLYGILAASWAVARPRVRWLLVPVASLVLPMAGYVVWWAGFSPAARYLVPIVPFCAVALADSLRARVMRGVIGALAVIQVPIAVYAWGHPRTLWPAGEGNPLLSHFGVIGHAYASWLPPVHFGAATSFVVPVVSIAVLNVVLVGVARKRRTDAVHAIS
jgi:hypothetical protein